MRTVVAGMDVGGLRARMRGVRAVVALALSMLALAGVARGALAQGSEVFPDELLDSLLQQGLSLDEATNRVAAEFDPAVAADLAVYLCTPPAHEACQGSRVYEAWEHFIAGIDQELMASEVAEELEASFDPHLAWGMAVYWCSPEPFDGCEGDPVTEAWSAFDEHMARDPNPADAIAQISTSAAGPLVASLIAAAECGESTCYAAELDLVDEGDFWDPEPIVEQQARQRPATDVQYGFKPDKPPGKTREKLCSSPAGRHVPACRDR
ncbi:MAG: hypothetical protein JSU87_06550 [Gemmatimonadota bacterium]|nr:MAG: hypothetical protein JSU87_06550 [Gemmatimonadota bacterium]